MKKAFLIISFFALFINSYAEKIQVVDGQKAPFLYTDTVGTNLDAIWVLYGLDNTKLSYTSTSGNTLKWYKYTTNINNLTLLKDNETGTSTLSGLENNTGYILIDGAITQKVWVIDYLKYAPTALVVSAMNDDPCSSLNLIVTAPLYEMGFNSAKAIYERKLIDLELPLKYNTMEYSEGNGYSNKSVIETLKSLTPEILIESAPLKNTSFTFGNDIFANYWQLNTSVATAEYTAVAVKAIGEPKHTSRDVDNETEKTKNALTEGSAPMDVTFKAFANEPTASYFKWEIASDENYKKIIASFSDKEVQYTFTDAGKYYARLVVKNNSNSCVDSSQVFVIEVTESDLQIPQAFSPNGDGKNDEFLVAYRSIVKFNGWIFNRWGTELFSWNNPAKGWDGKVNGKYVLPGVYFYVIEAVGSEGKKWKKSGDINVFSEK